MSSMDRQRKNVTIALLLLAATIALTAAVILTGGDDILVAVLLGLIAAELLVIGRITESRGDSALARDDAKSVNMDEDAVSR